MPTKQIIQVRTQVNRISRAFEMTSGIDYASKAQTIQGFVYGKIGGKIGLVGGKDRVLIVFATDNPTKRPRYPFTLEKRRAGFTSEGKKRI